MASKKKKQEAVETATVVDVAPAAEAPSAPAEVSAEAAEVVEQAAEVAAGEVGEETAPTAEVEGNATEQAAPVERTFEDALRTGTSPALPPRAPQRDVERARLNELWRMNGVAELRGVEQALREVLPGIKARGDVHRPALCGEAALTTAELVKALEDAGSEWAPGLRRWFRANHRRAGASVYIRLALAELEEGVSDEQGQGQDEGSADV